MAKAKAHAKPAGDAAKGLEIVAKVSSFWRAGIQFGRDPVTVSLADITSEQEEQLRNEPMLVVQDVDIAAEKAA